jgi:hypothetical protein
VYRALWDDKEVAVKELNATSMDREKRDLKHMELLDEGGVIASCSHRNICQIFGVGFCSNRVLCVVSGHVFGSPFLLLSGAACVFRGLLLEGSI